MGSHMLVSAQRLPSLQVLQSEEQTAILGAVRRMWFGGGGSASPVCGDPSAGGEVSPEQLLPERSVRLSS